MIKTVKGKVIAGTVAVTLFAGAGAAFGASNAGGKLEAWYNAQFGQASQKIVNDVATNAASKAQGWATEYEGIKTAATTSINGTKDAEFTAKSSSIDTAAQEHIKAINDQKELISRHMAGKFDAIAAFAQTQINQAGEFALSSATTDLTKHTGTKGSEALSSLETDLNEVTTDAKDDIQDAIDAAQGELKDKLASETTATTQEVIDMIDDKIEELRTKINAKKDELVLAQQGLITKKAGELETAAKNSLQDVVNGIK